jgi:ribulose bisphosphate carboxylase small subunit
MNEEIISCGTNCKTGASSQYLLNKIEKKQKKLSEEYIRVFHIDPKRTM